MASSTSIAAASQMSSAAASDASTAAVAASIEITTKKCLYDLPPELRNEIYELALLSPYAVYITKEVAQKWSICKVIHCREANGDQSFQVFEKPHFNTDLLLASRQIHIEAMSIFYGSNRFILDVDYPAGPFTSSTIGYVKSLRIVDESGFCSTQRRCEQRPMFDKGLRQLCLWAKNGALKLNKLQFGYYIYTFWLDHIKLDTELRVRFLIDLVREWMTAQDLTPENVAQRIEILEGLYGEEILAKDPDAMRVKETAAAATREFRERLVRLLVAKKAVSELKGED